MAHGPVTIQTASASDATPVCRDIPAFDATQFAELSEAIGDDGAAEMVEIFETETRQRMRRLSGGSQDIATQLREMHTLKGAASTVAAPRLAELSRILEAAARSGIAPAPDQLEALTVALEAYLMAMRGWIGRRSPAA
ncbi:MAG: Hpt domain-containing protein [Acetobacteraceae bacterium]|jgi:HPt (histidine-containing phosphotransfer) domain-containing protein